jgi:hypothetical protein
LICRAGIGCKTRANYNPEYHKEEIRSVLLDPSFHFDGLAIIKIRTKIAECKGPKAGSDTTQHVSPRQRSAVNCKPSTVKRQFPLSNTEHFRYFMNTFSTMPEL